MAWRFVKQPNGLLARFDEIIDNFTHANYSPADAVALGVADYAMDEASAKRKVQAAIDDMDIMGSGIPGSGLDRWNDALETIGFRHGKQAVAEMLKEMGFAVNGALKS